MNPIDENRSIPQEQLYVYDSEPEAELGSEHEPEELDHDQLWEHIRMTKLDREGFLDKAAPLSLVGSSLSENEQQSLENEEQCDHPASIFKTLQTLPSYIGQYEDHSDIIPMPMTRSVKRQRRDKTGLQLTHY